MRAAKIITGKAIEEHRERQRSRDERRVYQRQVASLNEAAQRLGMKLTRQQVRDIAKRAPKKTTA